MSRTFKNKPLRPKEKKIKASKEKRVSFKKKVIDEYDEWKSFDNEE